MTYKVSSGTLNLCSLTHSRSNITNFQVLLMFIMGHIPTKLHQFLISSFRNFLRTDTQIHSQIHRHTVAAQTIPTRSTAGAQVKTPTLILHHTSINRKWTETKLGKIVVPE